MDANRKKEIGKIRDLLQGFRDLILMFKQEEDDYQDGVPQDLREGEVYRDSVNFAENMQDAMDNMYSAICDLEEII